MKKKINFSESKTQKSRRKNVESKTIEENHKKVFTMHTKRKVFCRILIKKS